MEHLPNGITLELSQGAFPLSTDSMVLKSFAKLRRGDRVLDLGSGCGTLGLLLCAENQSCHVTGVELDRRAHETALENIHRNGLEGRLESICADLRCLPPEFTGRFDCCISNPPYFSGGPASTRLPLARRDDFCAPAELFSAAAKALKFGGDFFLVHRPERLAELIACASKESLEAKRLCLIRHQENSEATLILLAFRKGGRPGLKWEEASLFSSQGVPTPYYRRIYHLE